MVLWLTLLNVGFGKHNFITKFDCLQYHYNIAFHNNHLAHRKTWAILKVT